MSEPKRKPGRKKDPDSLRSKGGSRNKQPRKAFHAAPELFQALDDYINSARPRPGESECMRTALEEFLERRGFWPPKK